MKFCLGYLFGIFLVSTVEVFSKVTRQLRGCPRQKSVLQEIFNVQRTCAEGGKAISGLCALKSSLQNFKDPLDRFVDRLKCMIYGDHFDWEMFKEHSEMLDHQLTLVLLWAKSSRPTSILAARLLFANNLFQKMLDAVESIQFYNTESACQHLISLAIDLNVRSLAMLTPRGYPDPHVVDFGETVMRLERNLDSWRSMIQLIEGVKPSEMNFFERQFSQTKRTLGILERFIPYHDDEET